MKTTGEEVQVSYLLMEYIEGVNLIDFIITAGQQEDRVIRYIFTQIGRVLLQLHKAGIAHRDLKPDNMIITNNFELKIIDFGFGQYL